MQSQIQALSDRLNELDARPASRETHDPRVSELVARVNWVEQNAAAATQLTSDVDIEAIKRRIETIEEGLAAGQSSKALSPGLQAELSARLHSLEQAIEALHERADSSDVDVIAATLHKETDRWNQWARSTMQELAELRERVEGGAPSAGGGAGFDAESLESLAVQITSTIHTSEVKSLRGQMYFVYLALGVIWALLMYSLFSS